MSRARPSAAERKEPQEHHAKGAKVAKERRAEDELILKLKSLEDLRLGGLG
jgi:hypothetical protein